jgi:hypothetical protein
MTENELNQLINPPKKIVKTKSKHRDNWNNRNWYNFKLHE